MQTLVTEADLLAAVLADPEDNAPRLILADWWEENGQPERAEFVRVQCRIAATFPRNVDSADEWVAANNEHKHLLHRQKELLATPAGTNFRPDCLYGFVCGIEFRRGFVHSITVSSDDWLQHADAILKAQPVREVRLTTWPDFADNKIRQRRITQIVSQNLAVLWPPLTFHFPE